MPTGNSTTDGDDQHDDSTLEALASLPTLYHPSASPSGDRLAYYYDGTGRNELYVQDVAIGDRTQVSDGEVPKDARYPPVWDATGDRIYFHLDDDGDEQTDIHAITLDGDAERVVETDGQTFLWDVHDDGDWLLYSTTATGQMNLHRYDVANGESTQLTEYDRPVQHGRLAPDGDRIAYTTNERDDRENADVYVRDVDGSESGDDDEAAHGDARRLDVGAVGSESQSHDWHPDGRRLLVSDDATGMRRAGLYNVNSDDADEDAADGDHVTWYGPGEYEETPGYVLPDGERLLVVRTRECEEIPVVYDVDDPEDSGRELALPDGSATLPDGPQRNGVLADGRVLVTHEAPTTREEVHAYDLETEAYETLVDADYGRFDRSDFVDCDLVTYESTDGLEIEALCYDSGERPSPAIVLVHGGPHYAVAKRFDAQIQFLLERGYSLLLPNYRGSIGRGREFKTAIHNDWGGMEQQDIRKAGEWLKDREWIDDERVAVFGGSYGGYSTYMQLVTNPGFWTAGVAWVGMTDLEALYEDSMPHFKTALERQVGDPEDDADLYRERSAITHVDDMTDPILMVHGVNDPRCPISQARTFRDALEDRGWTVGEDFEYEELGAEGHGSTDVDDKIRAYQLLADFLERRL